MLEMAGSRVSDGAIGVAIGGAAAGWCLGLVFVWATYRRFRRVLRTIFALLGLWAICVPTAFFVGEHIRRGEEFVIVAIMLAGVSGTFILITTISYRRVGRTVFNRAGEIDVRCPDCGYSLVGLSGCQCPECGTVFTLDALIEAQDYVKTYTPPSAALPPADVPEDEGETPVGIVAT